MRNQVVSKGMIPKQALVASLEEGQYFGEKAIQNDSLRSATYITKTYCQFITIDAIQNKKLFLNLFKIDKMNDTKTLLSNALFQSMGY